MISFYDENCTENSECLPEEEARHAIKSLRMRIDEEFLVLNGKGLKLHCKVLEIKKKELFYKIISSETIPRFSPSIHLALSPLKQADRFETFIEKATELGVEEITPLLCHRSEKSRIKRDRLERIMIAALKQSNNMYLPKLNEAETYDHFVQKSAEERKFIAHCEDQDKTPLKELSFGKSNLFLIGPEGDFTSEEIHLAQDCHFKPFSMGALTLRAETAALTVSAYFHMLRS